LKRRHESKGVSPVISALALILILTLASETITLVYFGKMSVSESSMKAQSIEAKRAAESLKLDINPWLKQVTAEGDFGWITRILIVHEDGKTDVLKAEFKDGKIIIPNVKDGDRIGVITSLGNVYWIKQPHKGRITIVIKNLPEGYVVDVSIKNSEWTGSGKIEGSESLTKEVYPGRYDVEISSEIGGGKKSSQTDSSKSSFKISAQKSKSFLEMGS